MFSCNSLDLVAVEGGTLSHGRISLDVNAAGDGSLTELLVLKEGVRFDLVDDGLDATVLQQVVELLHVEIRDTDVLDEALVDGSLEVLPGLNAGVRAEISGRMDQVHVHVFELELLERVLYGIGCSLVVGIPQLRGDEDLLAGHAASGGPPLDRLTHSLLVGITGCAVDVTVACVESPLDCLLGGIVVGGLVHAQCNLRHGGEDGLRGETQGACIVAERYSR